MKQRRTIKYADVTVLIEDSEEKRKKALLVELVVQIKKD